MATARGDEAAETIAGIALRRLPDADLLASVGHGLASLYQDLLLQPPPPRIAHLIDRLGCADAAGVGSGEA